MKSPDEKRKHPRASGKYDWLVVAQVVNETSARKIITGIDTISRGGLSCRVDEPFGLGSRVRARMILPVYLETENFFRHFNLSGRVVREIRSDNGTYELGIAFEKISDEESRRIDHYVSHVQTVASAPTPAQPDPER